MLLVSGRAVLLEPLSHQGCHHEPGLDQSQDILPML
jgi:hypothetical protein